MNIKSSPSPLPIPTAEPGACVTRSEQLISALRQSQFPFLDSLIHLFVGGSELHGAKVKNTDDLDIYGVYLQPPELVLGLEKQDFYVWSTAGNERRNGPTTLTCASIRYGSGRGWRQKEMRLHCISCFPVMHRTRNHGRPC